MMMWSSSYYFFASTMFFSFLHVPLPVSCTSFRESVSVTPNNASLKFPAIFSFGDSIVDQGNNNNLKTQVKCNFPPYGKEFMGGFPTGRFSNAKTLLDILGTRTCHFLQFLINSLYCTLPLISTFFNFFS